MRPLVLIAAVLVLASCQAAESGSGRIVDPLELSISNQTSLSVTLVVNGQAIGGFAPGAHEDPIPESRFPPPPWHVEARTPSGRVLLTLDVKPGDVWHTTDDDGGQSSAAGKAMRVDLSCGRLDVWSGPPILGPPPPSSFPPGDCDP